jgi:hypothetical protein
VLSFAREDGPKRIRVNLPNRASGNSPDKGFMVVALPTMSPTTSSSMEPASTVEPTSTTMESSATKSSGGAPGATHHGSGMETASC